MGCSGKSSLYQGVGGSLQLAPVKGGLGTDVRMDSGFQTLVHSRNILSGV